MFTYKINNSHTNKNQVCIANITARKRIETQGSVDCLQFILSYTRLFKKAIGIFDEFCINKLVIIHKSSSFIFYFAISLVFLAFAMYIVYNWAMRVEVPLSTPLPRADEYI